MGGYSAVPQANHQLVLGAKFTRVLTSGVEKAYPEEDVDTLATYAHGARVLGS